MTSEIDAALDPFPYGGGTTSLLTLWMGVPVVTLRGNDVRQGTSATILIGAGLPRLVTDAASYTRIFENTILNLWERRVSGPA